MHNPASNNDKDPYEGKCHIRAQYVCVGVERGVLGWERGRTHLVRRETKVNEKISLKMNIA